MGRIRADHMCPILIPGTCEYVTFHDKRDFTDVMKDKNLEIGSLSWIIRVDPTKSLKEENFFQLGSESDRNKTTEGS